VVLGGIITVIVKWKGNGGNGHNNNASIDELHERLNRHIADSTEHCRTQFASCNTQHMEMKEQNARHEERYNSIDQRLARIEQVVTNGKH
jgi:hypothetical protein